MTRIIAGAARGRRLAVPPAGTRPTADRVRESLFSALESALMSWSGRRVIDLYAGSGALGLEALSRGASHALLVERDRSAVEVIRANIVAVGLAGAVVVGRDVDQVLAQPQSPPGYDLVLADPPYDLAPSRVTAVLTALAVGGWLADGATVVLERAARPAPAQGHRPARGGRPGPMPVDWPDGYEPARTRAYGDTVLHVATYRG
ncbi:MAG: 16S rRNA (guanine(966)-N(2))-methyltransferase RsmD [Candidatus Nanopelagicales bacterium]